MDVTNCSKMSWLKETEHDQYWAIKCARKRFPLAPDHNGSALQRSVGDNASAPLHSFEEAVFRVPRGFLVMLRQVGRIEWDVTDCIQTRLRLYASG